MLRSKTLKENATKELTVTSRYETIIFVYLFVISNKHQLPVRLYV